MNIEYAYDMIKLQTTLFSINSIQKKRKGRGVYATSLYYYYTIKSAEIQDLYRLLIGGILHISKEVCVWADKIGWSY